MQLVSFYSGLSRCISAFGSRFSLTPLVRSDHMHVVCMYLDAGDQIGRHPATSSQLFIVVHGAGWVEGGDGTRVAIASGHAVLWQQGEEHAAGSDEGMVAIVVESDDIGGIE